MIVKINTSEGVETMEWNTDVVVELEDDKVVVDGEVYREDVESVSVSAFDGFR